MQHQTLAISYRFEIADGSEAKSFSSSVGTVDPKVVRGARACEFLNIVSVDREDGRTDGPQVGNVGWVRPFGRRMQTKFIWCEREYDYHFLRWKGRKVRFGKQVPDKSVSVCTRRLEGGLSAV